MNENEFKNLSILIALDKPESWRSEEMKALIRSVQLEQPDWNDPLYLKEVAEIKLFTARQKPGLLGPITVHWLAARYETTPAAVVEKLIDCHWHLGPKRTAFLFRLPEWHNFGWLTETSETRLVQFTVHKGQAFVPSFRVKHVTRTLARTRARLICEALPAVKLVRPVKTFMAEYARKTHKLPKGLAAHTALLLLPEKAKLALWPELILKKLE